MSEMIFIPERNLFINLDQVISVEFEPEHDYVDDELADMPGFEPRTVHVMDKLTLVTTALELGQVDGYDGEFKGVASVSKKITITGHKAMAMFNMLVEFSARVTTDVVETK